MEILFLIAIVLMVGFVWFETANVSVPGKEEVKTTKFKTIPLSDNLFPSRNDLYGDSSKDINEFTESRSLSKLGIAGDSTEQDSSIHN